MHQKLWGVDALMSVQEIWPEQTYSFLQHQSMLSWWRTSKIYKHICVLGIYYVICIYTYHILLTYSAQQHLCRAKPPTKSNKTWLTKSTPSTPRPSLPSFSFGFLRMAMEILPFCRILSSLSPRKKNQGPNSKLNFEKVEVLFGKEKVEKTK